MGELVLPVMELSSQQVMNSTQQSQVEELLLPIGDNLVGVDPCYGDDFTIVKREIDRLSDTDYQEIAKLCKKILQKESKDLRVAGYFLISKVFIEGICGLLEGVELYLELVRRYAVSCHPQRANAKAQTIAWLNNEKLSAFVKKIELTNDGERKSVIDLKSLITSLNNELTNLYGDEITKWTSLNPWMDKNLPVSPLASVSVRLEKRKINAGGRKRV